MPLIANMTIRCKPGSVVPHFSKAEMDALGKMISLDVPDFAFDPAYLVQVEHFNGGVPENKYFKTRSGRCLPIDRFLNYSDTGLLADRTLKNLNANVVWSMIEDRLGIYLLPFAILPSGDFLCFDYGRGGARPGVVLWSHELSTDGHPSTSDVAESFEEFVGGLSSTFQQ